MWVWAVVGVMMLVKKKAEVNRGEKNAQEYFLGNSTFKLNPWWLAVFLIFHHLFFFFVCLTSL